MFPIQRRQIILDYVKKQTTVTVEELSRALFIGVATVRRDLALLDSEGLLIRTHGGAVKIDNPSSETPLHLRQNAMIRQKEQIIQAAAELVSDGDTLFLDSSSTVLRLVQKLRNKKNLTVITNGINCMLECTNLNFKTICTGGTLTNRSSTLVGSQAVDSICGFYVDKFFYSVKAVDDSFMSYEPTPEIALVKRKMMENAKKKILLCDASKFHSSAFARFHPLAHADILVTDENSKELNSYLSKCNTYLISSMPS